MRRFMLVLSPLLLATTLHAQSILDIAPGSSRDSAMMLLKGKYQIADTVVYTPGQFIREYDLVIRLAPVRLFGYDGWVAMHSDSTGKVTSISWSHAPWEFFGGDERWKAFTSWKNWKKPTRKDAEALGVRLDTLIEKQNRRMGVRSLLTPSVYIGSVEDDKESDSDAEEVFHPRIWNAPNETISLTYPGPLIILTRKFQPGERR